MRDTRWRKVWRDLWLHRGRSLTTVCAMTVCLLGASVVLDTWSLVDAATHRGYDATNPPAATLRLAGARGSAVAAVSALAPLVADLRRVPGVGAVHVRRTALARVTIRGVARTAMLFGADELATQAIGRVEYEQGAWPVRGPVLAMDYSVVEFTGAGLGDSVRFESADRAITLPIASIVRDAGLPPGWMDHVVYLFVTDSILQEVAPDPITELRFTTSATSPTRDAIRQLSRTLSDRLAARGVTVTHTEVPEPGVHVHAGQIESFLLIQGAFGALALALSGVLIVNLMSALLISQRPLIGVMKGMGATPRQLMGPYLVQAVALGGVSALFALPVAIVIGRAYAAFVATLLNFSVDGFSIPWWVFAVEGSTALLLPLLAALIPVRRACAMSVAETLRPAVFMQPLPTLSWLPARVRRFAAVSLTVRNLWRHQRRVAFTVLTLASGGSVFLGALQLRRSIQDSTAVLYERRLRYDATVRTERTMPPDVLASRALSVPGVGRAEGWPTTRAAIVTDGRLDNRFTITLPSPKTALLDMQPQQGRWLRVTDSTALVVSRELADAEPSLALGSWSTLLIDGVSRRWQVVGVLSIPGRVAYANREFAAAALSLNHASLLAIGFTDRDSATHQATLERVRNVFEQEGMTVAGIQRMSAARSAAEDHLVMVVDFLIVAAQVTVLVAAFGLASTMGLAVLERTREIGVMRAVGASPRDIMAAVHGEGLLIAALSALVAVPLSVPMSVILGAAFGRMMFPVPVSLMPSLASSALWFAVAVIVSGLACTAPARRATRISAREALSHD